jgi:hypothetical protein
MMVSNAGHTFPPAMFSNWSDSYPEGYLNNFTLFTFYGIYIDPKTGEMYSKPGWNQIPENWFVERDLYNHRCLLDCRSRRPLGYEYGLVAFLADLFRMIAAVPGCVKIGGNTGKVNSFAGIDLGSLTGGVFHTADLLNSSSLSCFVLQLFIAPTPDFVSNPLLQVLDQLISLPADCPIITKWNMKVLKPFTG